MLSVAPPASPHSVSLTEKPPSSTYPGRPAVSDWPVKTRRRRLNRLRAAYRHHVFIMSTIPCASCDAPRDRQPQIAALRGRSNPVQESGFHQGHVLDLGWVDALVGSVDEARR